MVGRSKPGGGEGPGCLVLAVRIAALGILGPVVALRRWVWRIRRGREDRSRVAEGPAVTAAGLRRVDWTLDVPSAEERAARRRVTSALVRIAGTVSRPGDVYHLVHRPPGEPETELRAVGPQLQALGDRIHGHLSRSILEGRTSLWPALERGVFLAEHVDPVAFDPDAPGEPDAAMATLPCRWAFALAWQRQKASTVFRVALWVPQESVETVHAFLADT